ncbi:MAG: hypothetical protein MJZ61_02395 [Bacteroidales bacterium]|nr:hypothetical protein [Bacteroidales bacterium]
MDFFSNIDWEGLFLFDPKRPLLFTQFFFWGFFFVVMAFYTMVYKRIAMRNIYLLLVSLFFYYKTGGVFVALLIFTVVSIYYITNWLHKTPDGMGRKCILAFGIVVNLLILFYFKYTAFIVDSINGICGSSFKVVNYFSLATNSMFGTNFVTDKIVLPVGISFFTFQAISYCVDVYRRQIEPVKNVLDFGFYVSFFPQLVAGPIVRASEFIPQIYQPYSLNRQEFGMAIFMILKGLIKKIFISDYISINFIDRVFDSPGKYSGFETLMSLYGYSLQVYTDFSGYTDIAIGLALLMGFKLSINFNSPYKAKSTAEFWHRWHISLSTWLKDYLYIPIGGNRNGSFGGYMCWVVILLVFIMLSASVTVAIVLGSFMAVMIVLCMIFPNFKHTMVTMMNNQITMLLGGLWHGSSWMFVIWGGYNGFGLVVYKLWKSETQIFRWIILLLCNLAAWITYHLGYWSNPNGVVLWVMADAVWIYAYLVWMIKISETRTYDILKYVLGAVLIACFSLVATVLTGLWTSDIGIISFVMLFIFTCAVFYVFDRWNQFFPGVQVKSLPLTIVLWSSFVLSISMCFLGYNYGFYLTWLLASVVLLSAYVFSITKTQIKDPKKFIAHIWGIFLTFNFITFTRIWFRAPDLETVDMILDRLLNGWGDISLISTMVMGHRKVFAVILFGMVIHWLSVPCKDRYTNWFINSPVWVKVAICVFTVFMLFQVKASDLQPFIYFQF